MKSKDQILLEEAYGQVSNNKALTDKINKSMSVLDLSIKQSPSVKSLYAQWSDILDSWNVFEMEKKQDILNSLSTLQKNIESQYKLSDADKYSPGVSAPTSQIKRTIEAFQMADKSNSTKPATNQQPTKISATNAKQQAIQPQQTSKLTSSNLNKQPSVQTQQSSKVAPVTAKQQTSSGPDASFDQRRFSLELSRLSSDLLNRRMPQQRNIQAAFNMLKTLDTKAQGATKERAKELLSWLSKSMGNITGPSGAGAAQFTATKLSQELQSLSKTLTQQK